jgi:hypothetical protein
MKWMDWCLNLRPDEANSGKWSIIGWNDGEWYVDIRGYKVVVSAYVDWGSFVVNPSTSIWLCTDLMSDLWDPVNRRSSMIIVVERYPTIPLEMSTRIVYEPPTDSPVCGIAWKTCTRERWDLNRPYDDVVKGCHMWHVRGRAYVVLVRFIPLQDWLLIWISATLSYMSRDGNGLGSGQVDQLPTHQQRDYG